MTPCSLKPVDSRPMSIALDLLFLADAKKQKEFLNNKL